MPTNKEIIERLMGVSDVEILAQAKANGVDLGQITRRGQQMVQNVLKQIAAEPLRDKIAIEMWGRFASPHIEDWEDEPHKQEFYLCADAIIRRVWETLNNPTPEMISAAYDQKGEA